MAICRQTVAKVSYSTFNALEYAACIFSPENDWLTRDDCQKESLATHRSNKATVRKRRSLGGAGAEDPFLASPHISHSILIGRLALVLKGQGLS